MIRQKTVILKIFLACYILITVSLAFGGCSFTAVPADGNEVQGSSFGSDPIVGKWAYSYAYDTSLGINVEREDAYFSGMTFYSDGSVVLVCDYGSSFLGTSEIKGEWQLTEELDGGTVYKVIWDTENSSPSFELFYLNGDKGEAICAWNVQVPADENVYLYYSRN